MYNVREIDKSLFEIDKYAVNGIYTMPIKKELDILRLRKYCRDNNKKYGDLTEEEIKKFEK